MATVFILTIILLALAFVGMAISILIKKGGKFPELHIGKNEKLREKGISCATSQDREARRQKNG